MPVGLKRYQKETKTQVFSCEICEIVKNTYVEGHLRTAASNGREQDDGIARHPQHRNAGGWNSTDALGQDPVLNLITKVSMTFSFIQKMCCD